jgi:hypothetical protein
MTSHLMSCRLYKHSELNYIMWCHDFSKRLCQKKSKSFFILFSCCHVNDVTWWRHDSFKFFSKKTNSWCFCQKEKFFRNLFIFPYWGHMTSRTFRKKKHTFHSFFFSICLLGHKHFSFFFQQMFWYIFFYDNRDSNPIPLWVINWPKQLNCILSQNISIFTKMATCSLKQKEIKKKKLCMLYSLVTCYVSLPKTTFGVLKVPFEHESIHYIKWKKKINDFCFRNSLILASLHRFFNTK